MLVIEISCRTVWKIVSDYVDAELDPELQQRMEEHLKVCRHCTAIVDGALNVVRLAIEDRVFEMPSGFKERLLKRLKIEPE